MPTYTVSTYYKKNVQEVEQWYQQEGEGRITTTNGFRWGSWEVTTTDGEPPIVEFTEVPGGDGKRDSIDMCSWCGENIDSVDLISMDDGGCWWDVEIEGLDEEEQERVQELIDEEGIYALEEEGGWLQGDTEWWIWGPIEIKCEETGYHRIVIADADGNVVDFKDE